VSGLVPERLVLKGIHPVAEGGFGDIYKERFGTQEIALKVLNIDRTDIQRLLEVTTCLEPRLDSAEQMKY
jgi:hypothetical protein